VWEQITGHRHRLQSSSEALLKGKVQAGGHTARQRCGLSPGGMEAPSLFKGQFICCKGKGWGKFWSLCKRG
jgi:hypothetical protein